jgi:hypothetical protein
LWWPPPPQLLPPRRSNSHSTTTTNHSSNSAVLAMAVAAAALVFFPPPPDRVSSTTFTARLRRHPNGVRSSYARRGRRKPNQSCCPQQQIDNQRSIINPRLLYNFHPTTREGSPNCRQNKQQYLRRMSRTKSLSLRGGTTSHSQNI